jgi:hypothetical protein
MSLTFRCNTELSGKLLLVLAGTVILGYVSRVTYGHILLFHDSGSRAAPALQYREEAFMNVL